MSIYGQNQFEPFSFSCYVPTKYQIKAKTFFKTNMVRVKLLVEIKNAAEIKIMKSS